MATDITVYTTAQAKEKCLALPLHGKIKICWRQKDDVTLHTWIGTVIEKKTDWVVCTYTEGPPDASVRYDLPYQKGGVEYVSIGPEEDPHSSGNMLTAVRTRQTMFQIQEWRPASWGHMLHPPHADRVTARAQLMGELKAFFNLKVRHELSLTSDDLETELATAYETLMAWIIFAQTIQEWKSPPILGLIEPLVLRLCALRRASPFKDAKRRQDSIQAVYRAANQSSATKDKVSELMLEPLARQ